MQKKQNGSVRNWSDAPCAYGEFFKREKTDMGACGTGVKLGGWNGNFLCEKN